jgi:hypothetical protein
MLVQVKSAVEEIHAASEAAIAEFIRTRGVTRCPTACVLPTQGSVPAHDREALAEYAEARDRGRQLRAARRNPFFPFAMPRSPG